MRIKQKSKGFSLIEVLIALLVLTIGLLGLANLQGQSISSSYNGHLRTQAAGLARNIIDRMRANRQLAMDTAVYETDFGQQPPATLPDCINANCTAAQMANLDLIEWKCNLGAYMQETICNGLVSQRTLPGGDGEITEDANSGQTKVTVRWKDTAGEQHEVIMFTSL